MRRKKQKPKTKLVRIDHKTLIEVDASIPDEKAIAEFLEKTEHGIAHYLRRVRKPKTNL